MEAHPRTLLRVFQPDIQYAVPIFQRRYVWNQEDQWEELWEDLAEIVEDVERVEHLNSQGAEHPLPSHFLGAIVCDQSLSVGSDIDARPLIDGQQRLTTLQILLSVVLRTARTWHAETAVGLLAKLVENDETLIDRPHDRFKLWPSEPDRRAFEEVLTNASASEPEHLVHRAAAFFAQKVQEWAGSDSVDERLAKLARTLRKNVELVVIDLQPGDNAQVIFESLNYGGRELTAIDLTKNHVFFQAQKQGIDPHLLHRDEWADFDDNWWGETITQGRLKRARAELLLMHWLKLERLEDVRAHRLFVDFRDLPGLKSDLIGTVKRLAADRDLYRLADERPAGLPAATGGFFRRLELLNQSTPRPLALQLLRAVPSRLTPQRASRAFHALDSYLWRRALTRSDTSNYNRLVLDLLKAVDSDVEHADDRIIQHLASLKGHSVRWWRDDELRSDLEVRQLYGQGRVARSTIATALRAIENSWREPRGEGTMTSNSVLQIEHMMPQHWTAHWPLSKEPEETLGQREQGRNAHIHRLGNLTLVNRSMNASLSNREWVVKRHELRLNSNMLITQRYLDDDWDEETIMARGGDLIDAIIRIWPGADGCFSVPAIY